ncbi:MAG: DUF6178 family protein [Polyangia bacterium]
MADTDKPAGSDVVALSRFRAALARSRTTKRADVILSDPDADRLIPTLPIQDLYLAIKDVGLADAEELVGAASPEQIQGFLDLDGWDGDSLSVDRMRPWIDTLATIGYEKLAEIVEQLDAEEVALFLQKQANVYDLSMDDLPEEPEGRFWPTPDTFYVLDILPSGEEGKAVERFVDHLYRADLELARRVVMAAKWEMPTDLEDWAYRFRQGRMADLGFPDADEAMKIYKPIEPATVRLREAGEPLEPHAGAVAVPGTTMPILIADAIDARSLLGEALGTLQTDAAIELSHAQLVTLFNRALAADRIDPSDLASARLVLDDVVAYLGLGLEYVSRGGDVALAGRALAEIPLERLFRVGFSLTASLGKLAGTLYSRGRVRVGEPPALLLEGRHREVVLALRGVGRGHRPRMTRALDTPPAAGTRPFRTAADVRLSASALQSASRVPVFFFDDLGLSLESAAEASTSSPGVTFGTLARTLAARILINPELLDGEAALSLSPLRAPEVGVLLSRLHNGQLGMEDQALVGGRITERLARRGRSAPFELETWFGEWFADLGRRVAEVDGLYVTG